MELVVFYGIAEEAKGLARKIGADVREIRMVDDFCGKWKGFRDEFRPWRRMPSLLQESPTVEEKYSSVWIGSEMHPWNVSSPVREWINEHREELLAVPGREFNAFCTVSADGAEKSYFAFLEDQLGVSLTQTKAYPLHGCLLCEQ